MILRRSRATNGFVGSYPARKRRRGVSVSRKDSRSLGEECAGRVVGLVVFIVKSDAPDGIVLERTGRALIDAGRDYPA